MATTITAPAREVPFSSSPDPTALYVTPALKAAIHKVCYTIDTRQGLALILGDYGLGKSTLLRYIFARVSALPHNNATFIPTPSFRSSFAMLQKICADFEIPPARSELAQQEAFERFLMEQFEAGKNTVIFIDEAQRLKPNQLELVRAMLNFETNTGKLAQLILAGQLELRDRLLRKRHRALASRVFAPAVVGPLEFSEMVCMLRGRCELHQVQWPFDGDQSLRILYDASGGVPRTILKACQMAFGLMIEQSDHYIRQQIMQQILDDLKVLDDGAE
jgi:general secretion pathway protein A